MLPHVAICCGILHYVAVYCSILQYVPVGCSMLQYVAVYCNMFQYVSVCCSMLQYVTLCCSILQYIAVYCSMFLYVALCCCIFYILHLFGTAPLFLRLPTHSLVISTDCANRLHKRLCFSLRLHVYNFTSTAHRDPLEMQWAQYGCGLYGLAERLHAPLGTE